MTEYYRQQDGTEFRVRTLCKPNRCQKIHWNIGNSHLCENSTTNVLQTHPLNPFQHFCLDDWCRKTNATIYKTE